jgi:hypothetical protein
MIDAKHIAALEAWLNKTRDEQNQLIGRLRDAESEAEKLRGQIAALDEIAQQAESMIDNALVLMRGGIGAGTKSKTNIAMDELSQSVPQSKPAPKSQSIHSPGPEPGRFRHRSVFESSPFDRRPK